MRHETTRRVKVDVWVTEPAGGDLGRWLPHLDHVERARAATLPALQASRFVQARVLLRGVLGGRAGCPGRLVALHVECPACGGPHGPVVVADGMAPFVSVTRAGPLIAVAVTDAGPVGVDIESHAAVSAAPLADVALSAYGLSAHRRRRRSARTPALARAWVSTEAALKAVGTGLRTDPAYLEIRSVRGRRTVITPEGTRVALADLDLGRGLAGAVAVVCGGASPTAHEPPGSAPRIAVRVLDGGAVLADLRGR